MEDNQQNTEIILKLGVSTQENKVDAAAVSSSMEAISSLITEVHLEFKSNSQLLIKARPFSKGSFEVPLELIIVMGSAMIYSTPVIRDILNVVKQYFEIKNLLKGATPNIRDGNIVLQNSPIQVDKIVINLLDPSNKSNQLISGAFNEIQKDQNIKNFSITEKKDYIAKVDRKQFDYYKPFVVEEKQIREITSREILKVVSAVFAEDLKWFFIRNEGRIHASITDKQFLEESVIRKGEPFRSGDKLDVDLKVDQEYDKLSGNYIDKQYTVTKIYDHIKRPETQPLF